MSKNDFNRTKVIADRHEEILRCNHAGFASEPFHLGYATLDGRLPPKLELLLS